MNMTHATNTIPTFRFTPRRRAAAEAMLAFVLALPAAWLIAELAVLLAP